MPVYGGEEIKVWDSFDAELGQVVNNGIFYISSGKDAAAMKFLDLTTRAERWVANLGVVAILPFPISVSPDHRQILYTQNDRASSDIML